MKKALQKWLLDHGFQSSYSGKTRTLYVHGISSKQLEHFGLSAKGITIMAG